MKHAFVFPGQGAQFVGMGKNFYDSNAFAKKIFEQANDILGFRISDVMFSGTDEDLKQTKITQPAIFLHSVIAFKSIEELRPDAVAGHSLGEFSALVANGVLRFEDGLKLVSLRAQAMQAACERTPSTMAAVLGLADAQVEEICAAVQQETGEVVVPANYNCPGQLVISGTIPAVMPVGGAFHSPLMEPAKKQLAEAIEKTAFHNPSCPVYQNTVAKGVIDKEKIQENLVDQLTAPVRWTQCVQAMVEDGVTRFTEVGPGKVLQGLIQKVTKEATLEGVG